MAVGSRPAERGVAIGQAARATGVSATALRFYEKAGVLPSAERSSAGYRVYRERDLERIRLVARAKGLGCTLEEIRDLVRTWDGQDCEPVKDRLAGLVRHKLDEIRVRATEQEQLAAALRAAAHQLSGIPPEGPCAPGCGCLDPDPVPGQGELDGPGGCGGASSRCGATGTPAAPEVPVVCTLARSEVADRLEAWTVVLADASSRVRIPGGLRLELAPGADLVHLVRLVAAEQACCSFLAFAVTVDGRGPALEVTAPPEGLEVLETMFGPADRESIASVTRAPSLRRVARW